MRDANYDLKYNMCLSTSDKLTNYKRIQRQHFQPRGAKGSEEEGRGGKVREGEGKGGRDDVVIRGEERCICSRRGIK